MSAARGDARGFLIVAHERRHVVTAAHERVEYGRADVSRSRPSERFASRPYIIVQPCPVTRSSTFSNDLARARGDFLVYDDGFRSRSHTYEQVARAARGFAARLHELGLRKGDKVVFWSENRPEWIVAFWGCLLGGIVVVPIDYRASPDFLARVSRIVAAKLVLIGQDVPPFGPRALGMPSASRSGSCTRFRSEGARRPARASIGRDDVAEIIFTSGATAEPKGVVITHRNVLANIVPVEREVLKYRKWAPAVRAHPLPEPPAAQPHVRPGDGDLHPADAAGRRRLHARLQPGRDRGADQEPPHLGARVGAEDPRRPARARAPRGASPGRSRPKQHFLRRWWRYRPSIGCLAGNSGPSSSAPRRSTAISRRSGPSWATWSFRATASRRPRRSSA